MGLFSPVAVNPESVANSESAPLADYISHYGLCGDPFETVDGLLYPGAQRQQLLDLLLHHCQFSASLLAVVGERGVGKSQLLGVLAQQLAPQDSVCVIDIPLMTDVDRVLTEIADSFGIAWGGESSTGKLLSDIRHYGQEPEQEESLALVLIDNAHNLDDQTLGALLSLLQGQEGCSRRLHIVLFGEPQLTARLEGLDAGDILIHELYLLPLQHDELTEYLQFRLVQAGFDGERALPFGKADIDRIWEQSQGRLDLVNELARRRLVASVIPADVGRPRGLPVVHLLAVVMLATVLLAVFFLREDGGEQAPLDSGQGSTPLAASAESVPVVLAKQQSAPREPAGKTGGGDKDAVVPVSESGVAQERTALVEVPEEDKVSAVVADGNSAVAVRPSAEGAVAAPQPVMISKSRVAGRPVDVAPAVAADEPVQELAKVDLLTRDERQLLDWDAAAVTLQVLGASSRDSVRRFVERQTNRDRMRVFTSLRQGREWHVVVVGRYADNAEARKAIAALPAEQKAAGPWPRSLLSVHNEIRIFRGL